MNTQTPELSVVILCYRAENYARKFTELMKEKLKAENINYELVLVGNYKKELEGKDITPVVVTELEKADTRIRAVAKVKEGMMGWDMRSGLNAATGAYVAVIDGDGQMPPEDVVKVYREVKKGFDVAKTYRDARHDGLFRVIMSKVYNLVGKVLFPRIRVRDINSKPKIMKLEALRKLKLTANDWFIDAEIIIKASYLGMKISEVPTQFFPNSERPSFVNMWAILEFVRNLVEYRVKMWRGQLL